MLLKAVGNSSHFEREQFFVFHWGGGGERKSAPAPNESKFRLSVFIISPKATRVPTALRLF